jgi:TRAP transporter TAXI family solute receptor
VLGNSQIGLDAMKDGKADIFMNARNPGDAQVKEIHSNRPLLWIDGDPEKIREAAATFSSAMHMLPKGTYPFFDKDYPTIRQWASLVAGAHVSDEVVYKYTKAVAENDAAVRKIGGAMGKFDTKLMIRNPANLPFHPGALRYYREKGWVK